MYHILAVILVLLTNIALPSHPSPPTLPRQAAGIDASKNQYVFAVHPHGVMSYNHAMLFLESACGFGKLINDPAGTKRVDLNAGKRRRRGRKRR